MKFCVFVGVLCAQLGALAQSSPALWEYGVGFGLVHFEQYPASNQSSNIFLPFPTFQYRGEIVRADDREGTRAYIFKKKLWSLEFSGGGYPPLDTSINDARAGMEDLPWMFHLGPQVVGHLSENLELRIALFQAISSDFSYTKFSGGINESQLIYRWLTEVNSLPLNGRVGLSVKVGTKDYLSTYFEVEPQHVTSARGRHSSKGGILGTEVNYFQSIKSGKTSYYVGASVNDYSQSANKESPLHKANISVNYLVGMTYTLGQSERLSVPESQTEGIINKKKN